MPYLMYGYAATVVLMLAGCCVIARTVPGLRGVRLLGWALGFGLVGVVLLAMRTFAPAWVTILLANEALFVCSLLIYSATADTLDVPAPFVPWGIGIMVAACRLSPISLTSTSTCQRAFSSAARVSQSLPAPRRAMLFQYKEPPGDQAVPASALRSLIAALAWLQMLVVVLQILRGILTVLFPPPRLCTWTSFSPGSRT